MLNEFRTIIISIEEWMTSEYFLQLRKSTLHIKLNVSFDRFLLDILFFVIDLKLLALHTFTLTWITITKTSTHASYTTIISSHFWTILIIFIILDRSL